MGQELNPKAPSDSKGTAKDGNEARQDLEAVRGNLESFLKRLGGLSCCDFAELSADGFCLSTGSDSASENWVFFRGALRDEEPVRTALRFFGAYGLPFIWPLLGEGREILSRFGLRDAGRLLAMSRGCIPPADGGNPRVVFAPVEDDSSADRWTETMWRGFGAESGVAENLRDRAREMRRDQALHLVTARIEGQDVGTFLLASDAFTTGVYYFAVLPGYRRSGVATAMMTEVLRIARNEKKSRVVLQATPSGVPFYRATGFEPLEEIPLYSASDDVF